MTSLIVIHSHKYENSTKYEKERIENKGKLELRNVCFNPMQVNYTKTIDKYLIGCFLFVFASLGEYSIVLFLASRMKKYQKIQELEKNNHKPNNKDASNDNKEWRNGDGVTNRVSGMVIKGNCFSLTGKSEFLSQNNPTSWIDRMGRICRGVG